MCGICGYVSKKRITEDELRTMNDTMIHRGPNDSGVELYDGTNDYVIGFAQRRLSIQDLSLLGHQPMHSENGRVSIVFNGEIYNFLELKKELSDYTFKSWIKAVIKSHWLSMDFIKAICVLARTRLCSG